MPAVSALYCPATHAVHTNEVVAELTELYLPRPHAVHAVAAASALYAPAVHAVQTRDVGASDATE